MFKIHLGGISIPPATSGGNSSNILIGNYVEPYIGTTITNVNNIQGLPV